MASRIQIARGNLPTFQNTPEGPGIGPGPIEGELFWQARNTADNVDLKGIDNKNHAYDEGTLFIGHPALHRDESGHPVPERPIPIAGTRTYKSLVCRGIISNEALAAITSNTPGNAFETVREGDFFILEEDAFNNYPATGEFGKSKLEGGYDFRKNDILLITEADGITKLEPDRDEVNHVTTRYGGINSFVRFTKIDCSGGDAYQTRFRNQKNYYDADGNPLTKNDFKADNVQEALEELESEKLSYRGTLSTQEQVDALDPTFGDLDVGSLYLVLTDGLEFHINPSYPANGINDTIGGIKKDRKVQKGDFVYWVNDEIGWWIIPSGYTDSEDIDFDPTLAMEQQKAVTTFDEDHIAKTGELTDVKQALEFLLSQKAQLDHAGKVPLSQLHDTVLGAMQYMGTWDPLIQGNLVGERNPDFQKDWPESLDTDGSGEPGPHRNGDYYIVQTAGKNIQYCDKSSKNSLGEYDRIIELNSGDWIVYSSSPVEDNNTDTPNREVGHNSKTNTDGGLSVDTSGRIEYGDPNPIDPATPTTRVYHWAKIDNSDRITQLNFEINGEYSTGEALTAPTRGTSRIGTPTFAASDKLVLWEDGSTITVAGVRLVSQFADDKDHLEDGKIGFLPRYRDKDNVIENSSIENFYKDATKDDITIFHSDISVGTIRETFKTQVHGDIILFPHLKRASSTDPKDFDTVDPETSDTEYIDTRLQFLSATTNNVDKDLKRLTVEVDHSYVPDSRVFLPRKSSKIIGKLAGVDLISGRITKSTENGFIDSTSIEEHTREATEFDEYGNPKYTDNDVDSVEIHSPTLSVVHTEVRHIIFGQKDRIEPDNNNIGITGFDDKGHLPAGERLTHVYANEHQIGDVEIYLPSRSGTLITTTDLDQQLRGDEKRLPIFGKPEIVDGKPRKILINSNLEQTANALFNTVARSTSIDNDIDLPEYTDDYDVSVYREETTGKQVFTVKNSPDTYIIDVNHPTEYSLVVKKENECYFIFDKDETGAEKHIPRLYAPDANLPDVLEDVKGIPLRTSDPEELKKMEDLVVESNLVIGKLSKDPYGNKFIEKSRNLMVTGNTVIAPVVDGKIRNITVINPTRTHLEDSQYRNWYTEEQLPEEKVSIDLPPVSGVLITSNSRLDGGYFG